VKKKVEIIIFLLFGLAFLMYLFPFIFVEAAKLQSGVTINAPATTETEKICDDTMDNDNDGKIDADDPDCAAAPTGPTARTCGLQIVSGVPINYGQLTAGQASGEKQVLIKNEGTVTGNIMIKGGDWISDSAPNPTISGPGTTRVGIAPLIDLGSKKALSSDGLEFGQISGGKSEDFYFQFRGFVNGPSGSFHQEVTIDLLC